MLLFARFPSIVPKSQETGGFIIIIWILPSNSGFFKNNLAILVVMIASGVDPTNINKTYHILPTIAIILVDVGMTFVCLRICFTFYHGKPPLIHR